MSLTATQIENFAKKGKILNYQRLSTSSEDSKQTLTRQQNEFYQWRHLYQVLDKIVEYFVDDGKCGGPSGRSERFQQEQMIQQIRGTRKKVLIVIADFSRFMRDFAWYVAFWDEFIRNRRQVTLLFLQENVVIDEHTARQEMGYNLLMSWQSESFLYNLRAQTVDGIKAYREKNPDKSWGAPVKSRTDQMLVALYNDMKLNDTLNLSELSRELSISRSKIRSDIKRLGLAE